MLEELPAELLFHIANFLDPLDIVRLQAVSKRLFKLGRDNQLWKLLTFENSQFGAGCWGREKYRPTAAPANVTVALPLQQAAGNVTRTLGAPLPDQNGQSGTVSTGEKVRDDRSSEKARALANWDPSYPTERVDWYSEYIARYAPLSMKWLQQPTAYDDRGGGGEKREVQGMALSDGCEAGGGNMVVAPLDDGSVCMWDISEPESATCSRQGSIIARSKAGLLSVDGEQDPSWQDPAYKRAKMTSTGVVECVSVDSFRRTAYFAVQSALNEVDLETLQVVSHQRYPFSISALSEAQHPLPLTVGTTLSLHLHDPRHGYNARTSHHPSDLLDQVATFPASPLRGQPGSLQRRLASAGTISPPATLFRPGPLSILHLDPLGSNPSTATHHPHHYTHTSIFVAGRFPSILHYSRRAFPRLHSTIHSGARLCALTSLPFPFSPLDHELTHLTNPLSAPAVRAAKSRPGTTLVAAGEYNGKGSLELYGLRPPAAFSSSSSSSSDGGSSSDVDARAPIVPSDASSSFKNRVSASSSKLLSVAPHGTRLVYADGDGALRWVERDGSTAVRSWNINASGHLSRPRRGRGRERVAPRRVGGLFGASSVDGRLYSGNESGGGGDVARKILTTGAGLGEREGGVGSGREGLLILTGERVGMVKYGEKSDLAVSAEEVEEELEEELGGSVGREERIYGMTMRRALERQADEVRFVRGLGLGG